jgi:phenylacetate-CoA ligase
MSSWRRLGIGLYEKATGRNMMRAYEELLRTQWLDRDRLHALQAQKMRSLVEHAVRHVPYYQHRFKEAGFEPGDLQRDAGCFTQLPTVDKAYMREHRQEFVTTDPAVRKTMQMHSTSGSTGHPFIFWEDSNYRDHVTADILRHLTWAGWQLGEPHAYLWGAPLHRSFRQGIRSTFMDVALNRFVSNACLLTEGSMLSLAWRIQRHRPRLLFGYASSLFHFAEFLWEREIRDVRLEAVFSSAEVLYPHQRAVIERSLGCRVFDRYGALEAGGLACECEAHAGLHVSMENCVLEVLKDGRPARPGETGEVVITNLNNYGFPFIRYRLGDVARLSELDRCPCGRQHPLLDRVEGRQVDLFKTRDGRTIWGDFQSTVFEVEGIKQFQIVQKSVDLILIRLVTGSAFQSSQLDVIKRAVRDFMGPEVQVRFEFLEAIPMGNLGKFRYAISEI